MSSQGGPVLIRSPVSAPIKDMASYEYQVPSRSLPGRLLVTSPYLEEEHLLDFRRIGLQEQLLATALSGLRLRREDYATAPYEDTFNWEDVVADLRSLSRTSGHTWRDQSLFVVAFRSQIPPTTDRSHLGDLDKAAHAEAVASGGFLKYWFGEADADGRNLATCVWRSPEDARAGGIGPAHQKAARSARHLYTEWKIERIALRIEDDVRGWSLKPWSDAGPQHGYGNGQHR